MTGPYFFFNLIHLQGCLLTYDIYSYTFFKKYLFQIQEIKSNGNSDSQLMSLF